MQVVEMYSHIKMWPKGLSGNNSYTTLQIHREPVLRLSASPVVALVYQLIGR